MCASPPARPLSAPQGRAVRFAQAWDASIPAGSWAVWPAGSLGADAKSSHAPRSAFGNVETPGLEFPEGRGGGAGNASPARAPVAARQARAVCRASGLAAYGRCAPQVSDGQAWVLIWVTNHLKSISGGYASFDYRQIGHREGELVKINIRERRAGRRSLHGRPPWRCRG